MSDHVLDIAPAKITERVSSLFVVLDNGEQIRVPLTADANRCESQIVGAKLRKFMGEQLELFASSKAKLKPVEIDMLARAAAKIEEVNRFAFAPGLLPEYGGEEKGKGAMEMVKAVAEGVANAHMKGESERMKKVLELGKKQPVIDVPNQEAK